MCVSCAHPLPCVLCGWGRVCLLIDINIIFMSLSACNCVFGKVFCSNSYIKYTQCGNRMNNNIPKWVYWENMLSTNRKSNIFSSLKYIYFSYYCIPALFIRKPKGKSYILLPSPGRFYLFLQLPFTSGPFSYILFYNLTLFLEWMFVIKLSPTSPLHPEYIRVYTSIFPAFLPRWFSIECGPRCIFKMMWTLLKSLALLFFTPK